MTKKIIICTSSYIINEGICSVLKELNFDIIIKKVNSINKLTNSLKGCNYQYFITDTKMIENLYKMTEKKYLKTIKTIVFGDQNISFPTGINIIKRIPLNQTKNDIYSCLLNIFKEKISDFETQNEISNREKEVIKYVAKGYTNKEIAEKLFLSIHTVTTHRKNITKKLDIKTISGITIYAILNNIINIEEV